MIPYQRVIKISVIPLLILAWGIFNMLFFDPFYSKSSDPEFPYLINGLNCALLKFNYIGIVEHPGTPFQVFCGLSILLTHLVSGSGGVAQDVFSRPELYLAGISIMMLTVQVILTFFVGYSGFKGNIPVWQLLILQASVLYNDNFPWMFCRVNPDRFFMIVMLLFLLIYLRHGYQNRALTKFALWGGVIMSLGLATKFNFFPVLFMPLFILRTNKSRIKYICSGIISFFIFLLPVIERFTSYRRFLGGIFKHDGLYGQGEARVFNIPRMWDNFCEIFRLNQELYFIIPIVLFVIIYSFRKRAKEGYRDHFVWFSGFLVVLIIQMTMVSKHFKNYYMAPTFMLYGLLFFWFSIFLYEFLKNRRNLIIAAYIVPAICIFITVVKVQAAIAPLKKDIVKREQVRAFVDNNISGDDIWFVEPTWESGPYVENAIVYGLSYCGYRHRYLPQLNKVNPNIITYEDDSICVKQWRGRRVSLDSVLGTGKNIYIYSTPGRRAALLLEMLDKFAIKDSIQLKRDTVFADMASGSYIIKTKPETR